MYNQRMKTITIVTGNAGKLREYADLIPTNAGISLINKPLDLLEIQSLDSREIVAHKLRQAYEKLGTPVIVEDVAASLDGLQGLPGPFIKFFLQRLGSDVLYQLAPQDNNAVSIICTAGFYDGQRMLFGEGVLRATIVAPRGDSNFGFDPTVVPEGQTRTLAEITLAEKNAISHRSKAIKHLLEQLQSVQA